MNSKTGSDQSQQQNNMIDKTENSEIYFTILPSNAGFTDQLLQFSTFYKFGLSLGYTYKHSTFVNTRHGAEDIFEFLGFNEHFAGSRLTDKDEVYRRMGTNNCFARDNTSWRNRLKRKVLFWLFYNLHFREFNFIDIGLGDTAPLEEGKDPLEALGDLIRTTVARNSSADPRRKNVVRFHLTGGKVFFRQLAPLLNQRTPCFPDDLDLRSTYHQLAEQRPESSKFVDGKLKVLVHIRLGDTAIIDTPWNTFIPLWAFWCISPLKEHPDKSDPMFQKLMDVEDFAGFLRRFYTLFDASELSTAVFSDGYKTAFKDLFAKIDDLALSNDQIRALKDASQTYEARKFSAFDDLANCVCCVGETNEDLQALAAAALDADIIIVGCHQRMIPKFLSTYYDARLDSPPVIIALHNGIEPRYRKEIGLSEEKAKVYPVNLAEPGSGDALSGLVEDVRQRQVAALEARTG